ncbi:hypothetical protein [Paenisporosarcina sp. OV554]|uniref:hypothetical protein n=1 Tax=Paenisporosarcina sp. OV554 TaxID=2135694 RepID=UPI000D381AB6|nr:hypothetical protein [Paenisporosarcina sp. OV554]PUB09840.1 hypothetical protein C8K15_12429 [Paenisporosarcina sp. OV554]
MLSRSDRYKKQKKKRRLLQVFGALIISVSIGSGVTTVNADQDISSLLTNWFNGKQSASIQEIDKAITAEKELLKLELKEALKAEMQAAEHELDTFTVAEKNARIASLNKYAEELIAKINIDNSAEKAKVTNELNAIIANAIKNMDAVKISPATPKPKPEKPKENSKPKQTPEPPPVTEPVPEPVIEPPVAVPVPEPVTEPVQPPVAEPTPEPVTVTEPITEPNPDPASSDAIIDSPQANRNTDVEDEKVEVE